MTSLIETKCHHGKSIEDNHSALPSGFHHFTSRKVDENKNCSPEVEMDTIKTKGRAAAAEEVAADLASWNPYENAPNGRGEVNIDGSNCNPCVKDDALGFFLLVLSYAKSAEQVQPDTSPKMRTSIMPRTNFAKMFELIKPGIPHGLNDKFLYDIVKILACYRNEGENVAIDSNFCSGEKDDPKPNGKLDSMAFPISYKGKGQKVHIQEWMDSLEKGEDELSKADKIIDGQIGGLGSAAENVLDTDRPVPLFESTRSRGRQESRLEQVTSQTRVSGTYTDHNGLYDGHDVHAQAHIYEAPGLCPDDARACDSTTPATIDKVPTVVNGVNSQMDLKYTITDSAYNSTKERDRMLAAAVSSWERAASKSCKWWTMEFPMRGIRWREAALVARLKGR
ncbi:hypothetical protein VTN00DRAFT_3911 [Thermoascus crustaceus]|uniref:uncharacterized protein n=1 Tax=Thermoascus crustaceus TaxID=5088 RepID=UPI0037430B2E